MGFLKKKQAAEVTSDKSPDLLSQAQELKGEAMELKGEAMGLKADAEEVGGAATSILQDIIGYVSAPVAGPLFCRLLFLMCVGGITVYFIFLLVDISKTWSEAVTDVSDEFVLELEYPDLYVCIPAKFTYLFTDVRPISTRDDVMNTLNTIFFSAAAHTYNEAVKPTAEGGCSTGTGAAALSGGSAMVKQDVLSFKMAPDGCPVQQTTARPPHSHGTHVTTGRFAGLSTGTGVVFGCRGPEATECITAAAEADTNDDATVQQLASLLQDYTYTVPNEVTGVDEDYTFEPLCFSQLMKPGAKQSFSEDGRYQIAMSMKVGSFTAGVDGNGDVNMARCYGDGANVPPDGQYCPWKDGVDEDMFLTVYPTVAGTKPYTCDASGACEVNVNPIFVAGPGSISLSFLNVEKVRDLREDPNAGYETHYKYNTWTRPLNTVNTESYDEVIPEMSEGYMGFMFQDFTVRYITIRDKTTTEILSEVGGLWAACSAMLLLLWSKSGAVQKKGGSEMYIFKYLPGKLRRRFLANSVTKDAYTKVTNTKDAPDAPMAKALEDAQQSMASMTLEISALNEKVNAVMAKVDQAIPATKDHVAIEIDQGEAAPKATKKKKKSKATADTETTDEVKPKPTADTETIQEL